eukprot:7853267-Prorocentrum_lima.AAC.1
MPVHKTWTSAPMQTLDTHTVPLNKHDPPPWAELWTGSQPCASASASVNQLNQVGSTYTPSGHHGGAANTYHMQ